MTEYAYDNLGRLTTVAQGGRTATYTYDINGNRDTLTNGPVETSYTYNRANLVTQVYNVVDGEAHSDFRYGYYLDGNQLFKHDYVSGEYTEYEYNDAGRLSVEHDTSGMYDIGRVEYGYDDAGNRTVMNDDRSGFSTFGRITEYLYDDNNRLTDLSERNVRHSVERAIGQQPRSGYTPPAGTLTVDRDNYYEYDSAGRQTGQSETLLFDGYWVDLRYFYTYDAYGRLTEFTKEQNSTYDNFEYIVSEYTYRPDGLRHSKQVYIYSLYTAVHMTTHVWDGGNIAADMSADSNGTLTTTYYVRGINLLYSEDSDGNVIYYVYNAHGDVVGLVGETEKSYHYDAFGKRTDWPGNYLTEDFDPNPFRYCGEYWDDELGTVYLRARYYDPGTGRFLSEDSFRGDTRIPQSRNLYVYCGNNPVVLLLRSTEKQALAAGL